MSRCCRCWWHAATGRLSGAEVRIAAETRVGVVLASRGYPESSESGMPIAGIDDAERVAGVAVFHAGTSLRDGRTVTSGGRVLAVVGSGLDYATAIAQAYDGVEQISFDGMQYRRDIGKRALQIAK